MDKNFIKDESGYVGAVIALITTVLIAYMIFIAVMPVYDFLADTFIERLDDNQFYTDKLHERLTTAQGLGWSMPYAFIGIAFIFVIVRTIIKQRYTRYTDENNY